MITRILIFFLLSPLRGDIVLSQSSADTDKQRSTAAIRAALAEDLAGEKSPFPPGTRLDQLILSDQTAFIYLSFPEGFIARRDLSFLGADEMVSAVVGKLSEADPALRHFHVLTRDPRTGLYRPVSDFLPDLPAIPQKPFDGRRASSPGLSGQPAGFGQNQPRGALSGKTVFLSQSHGWYWHSQLGWITQRPNTNDIVEDFITPEAIDQYLVQYLWNAGADVWACRERDLNTDELIVDDKSTDFDTSSQTGIWDASPTDGYEGGGYRLIETSPTETASATWSPNFRKDGSYAVYAFYLAGQNRAPDVKYTVNHAGGTTTVWVNQQQHGSTWRYLGNYYFHAGRQSAVRLSNESSESGRVVIADALRFGGGQGSISRGGGTSNRPRWEEAARYFAQFMGAPSSVYDPLVTGQDSDDDVTARPRYSEWEKEPGEDGVYISWHTNAADRPNVGTGTETYIHDTAPSPGSMLLQETIHNELINDIRRGWNPTWTDRGKKSANFGEVRLLSTMPGVLIELAFHDTTVPDALSLQDARFRQLAARAIYQGIVKYFGRRDGINPALLPEPPTHLSVRNITEGRVALAWRVPPTDSLGLAGDAATRYKVYRSSDGKGFDNGIETTTTSIGLTDVPLGRVYYFRVTALNDGGESFPTETLAVRGAPLKRAGPDSRLPLGTHENQMIPLLIVNGFDRIDRFALIPQFENESLGTVKRMFLSRMNTFDYVIEHADAAGAFGVAFDSCSSKAVRDGLVRLNDYRAVDWILGKESTADRTFDELEQGQVKEFLSSGGNLFVSGSEIAWDLDNQGSANDRSFYREYLKAAFVADNAGTYQVRGAGGIFTGLGPFFFDNGSSLYDVNSPDQLLPQGGSVATLTYVGGRGGIAGVQFEGSFRVINLGFPVEAILERGVRREMIARVFQFFGLKT